MKKKKKIITNNTPIAEIESPKSKNENYNEYQDNGLLLTRESSNGQEVNIVYSGLLAQNGASDIYAHAGVGEQWDNVQDVKMIKTTAGKFEATLLVGKKTLINICFRNENSDWDNNNQTNYSYSIK